MRCGNIRIHVEIPVYADKNNCFCDDNHVSYSIPAIRKACETASNLPIIQYDEQGTEKVVGVAQSIKWNPHGFIEVDGQLLFGGTNETVELGRDDCVVSMELSTEHSRTWMRGGEFTISMMSKEEMQVFSKLFSKYCRQEINRGHCEPDCCDFCPVNSAYDEIFNRFTDDEEDSNDDDE